MSSSSSSSIASMSRSVRRHLHRTKNLSTAIRFAQPFSSSVSSAPSSQAQHAQDKERSRWSKWLLFLPGALSFGLGTWQIIRREEKIKMLEYRKKRLDMDPMIINSLKTSNDRKSLEFRKLVCQGTFDEKRSIYLGPRSRSISGVTENGYYLITPLMPIANNPESVQSPVLVNRGWVPRSWREKHEKALEDNKELSNAEPDSVQKNESSSSWRFWSMKPKVIKEKVPVAPAKVIGVVRESENPSIFVPHNDPESGQWFWADVPAMAQACGLPENTIYIEDINEEVNPSNPYPIPKDVNSLIRYSVMPQDHLNYILTWYSLSSAVTFMAYKRLRQKKKPKIARHQYKIFSCRLMHLQCHQ